MWCTFTFWSGNHFIIECADKKQSEKKGAMAGKQNSAWDAQKITGRQQKKINNPTTDTNYYLHWGLKYAHNFI